MTERKCCLGTQHESEGELKEVLVRRTKYDQMIDDSTVYKRKQNIRWDFCENFAKIINVGSIN